MDAIKHGKIIEEMGVQTGLKILHLIARYTDIDYAHDIKTNNRQNKHIKFFVPNF